MSIQAYNQSVGEIVLRKDESFWILPAAFISSSETICSPWFSYMGGKWRLIKQRSGCYTNVQDFIFRLWIKSRCNPSKKKHAIRLSLRTRCSNHFIEKTGEIDSDYGCALAFYGSFCKCHSSKFEHLFFQNQLWQIFFDIQEIGSTITAVKTVDEEASNENEEKDSEECEEILDEENDEVYSDEDCSKNKNATGELEGIKILAENLKQVLLDKELSDLVVKVEDREFNVHKVILAARSSVFASMFKHDLTEKKTNEVDIPDCTAESFEVFLYYLYSGSIDNVSKINVWNLYYAADKYQVADLKQKCVKFMIKNLSSETVCDAIALALRHRESKLQKEAIGFFSENIKKIIKSVQWQKYMAENPTHANELLIKALNA